MPKQQKIPESIRKILEARHHDPFEVLGRHPNKKGIIIRAFIPDAANAFVEGVEGELAMQRMHDSDLFQWSGNASAMADRYRLVRQDPHGERHHYYDPYCFPPAIADFDRHLFGEGRHHHAYRILGAQPHSIDGIDGVLFATWAPNAQRISVVGDFNQWDGRCHPMRSRGESGLWELFVPGLKTGTLYKFEILGAQGLKLKSDPYARQFEMRPATAAIVDDPYQHQWQDANWMEQRRTADWLHTPMSIYEVHLGSWQRGEHGEFLNYRELAQRLVDYISELNFTHIELLPITEHPFDGSWGYQTTGYYAASSRFGSPDDLRYLIDLCHQNNIGVLLDWVPAHFPKDDFALANFDGTPLYEHEDPLRGEHKDWGTLIFNYGRKEVKNFLISNVVFWLEEFHLDGIRVDAVASMLYLDYSREDGEWVPNIHGGNENLEAVDFLRELNMVVHESFPGALTMAEESTSWPMVSRPVDMGGLGFSMKWNMGWMNDTLDYMEKDPIHRSHHHNQLSFGLIYAFTENFILPFSHDEVVHQKKSMLYKMPGDEWQRLANLRLLYTYMYTHPGKKLLFMGDEFGHGQEWNHDATLDWYLLDHPQHKGIQKLVGDLNRLYCQQTPLHRYDFEAQGFQWLECNDSENSMLCYLRNDGDDKLVIALNFTPVPHHNYRIGVPETGTYEILLNSDSHDYLGSDINTTNPIKSETIPWMGQPQSIQLALPPLAGLVLKKK